MYKLVVGLGNPESYRRTRHNIGKQFLDSLVSDWQISNEGYLGEYLGRLLFKPSGYMNLCGVPVKSMLLKLKIPLQNVVFLHDDLELNLGKVKLKKKGSAQGHNGIRSIQQHLGTDQFDRVRIGIGRPNHDDVSGFVLSNFTRTEQEIVENEVFPNCENLLGLQNSASLM